MNKNGTTTGLDERVDALKESVRDAVDYGGKRAAELKERMIDVKDTVVSTSSSAATRMVELVKEHPFAALGIAFGIGYLAMRIARR